MIRHLQCGDYLLFTQHDHALLSGRLAEHLGGVISQRPSDHAIQGIALHDCGWPLHDDCPRLNERGEPLHVFETPPPVSVQVWSASARRAANNNAYSGLLVSIHVLGLSALSLASHRSPHDVFELNKFQHQQIELQEELRRMLGMRVDLPLTQGLAKPGASPAEDLLLFDYRLLRAMDQLSLALLCSDDLFDSIKGVFPKPGGAPLDLRVQRPAAFQVRLGPWPFDAARIELAVPCKRVRARAFRDADEFREDYDSASIECIEVGVQPSD